MIGSNTERRLIANSVYNRLPKRLNLMCENFEGREKDIVLLSSLGVLSNCLPNIYGYYDGDIIYPHLYIMIIAPAASGKGVMNYSRALISPIHDKIFKKSTKDYLECAEENKGNKNIYSLCPSIEVKILPANISTSEMYSFLGSSKHGLLIMESEADTMSNMLNNDWSNYSDVLRKAFHHEPVSISRKIEKIFEDIKEPKLAMVISGTPDQLQPLIKSKSNGLFSRFVIYNFDEINDFKDVFAEKTRNHKIEFERQGEFVMGLYDFLAKKPKSIEFTFTKKQQAKFLQRIRPLRAGIISNNSEGFVSNLHRHALVQFRIAMILTVLRQVENDQKAEQLVCTDVDFVLSQELMQTFLIHSQYTYNTIDDGVLSLQDYDLIDDLNSVFTTQDAYKVGIRHNVHSRTMIDKLAQWQRKRIIKRFKKGSYKKLM